ncbi:MAG: NDMA-dependent alcohol dehydrogenase [Firmicutes bacterium]|nr:NDMA-dependent alcohol dehydrogenase [Alicyclobacillaceae bacterium]MCL6497546.1 NDMA-dependent alcohol dehydrogenase [Bacillota bacterium]
MKTKAAVVWEPGGRWEVEELELDPPREHEVLVRMVVSGLCHSDEHLREGDLNARYPIVGGHEGSGVVEAVGPNVTRVKPGDHVVCSFIPSCGTCRWCSTGHQNLCDLGASIAIGNMLDGTFRMHARGQDIGGMCLLGTFSERIVVPEYSVVRIENDIPLDVAAMVSCGVTTGWGAVTYAANTRAGETLVVYGVGGVGMNVVQGAKMAGCRYIVAVDPQESKRRWAKEFGATHTCATYGEAQQLVTDLTWGQGADKAIITAGVVDAEMVTAAFNVVGKLGTVVVVGLSAFDALTVQVPGMLLTVMEKRIVGSLFGSANPQSDIPYMLHLYRAGKLKLGELITKRYRLEDINRGYQEVAEGLNIRGVIDFTL